MIIARARISEVMYVLQDSGEWEYDDMSIDKDESRLEEINFLFSVEKARSFRAQSPLSLVGEIFANSLGMEDYKVESNAHLGLVDGRVY